MNLFRQILQDKQQAHLFIEPVPLPPVVGPDSKRAAYIRYGRIALTEETRKMEVNGSLCGVRRESNGIAEVYVIEEGKDGRLKASGPYTLNSSDIE